MAKKGATKEALLTAAIDLFQKHGFENITIDDICNANQVLRIIETRIRHVTKAGVALTKELYRIYLNDQVIPVLPEQGGLTDIVISLIERAQQEGQIKRTASPKILGDSLCCLSNGIILKWIMTGGEFDITDENRLLFEALFL